MQVALVFLVAVPNHTDLVFNGSWKLGPWVEREPECEYLNDCGKLKCGKSFNGSLLSVI